MITLFRVRTAVVAAAILMTAGTTLPAGSLISPFSTIPTGWTVDRYAPASFTDIGSYEGMNDVLALSISNDDGALQRPDGQSSMFYNTQGEGYALSGGAGSSIEAALYVSQAWDDPANGSVRTDLWGVMTDGSDVTGYPIIGFTNYGDEARFRVWDDSGLGGWIDLTTAVDYDTWTTLGIAFTGTSYEYFINGVNVATLAADPSTTGFERVILQGYNFDDPTLAGANPQDYTAHWANAATTPEPSTFGMLGAGLLGVLAWARRRARR